MIMTDETKYEIPTGYKVINNRIGLLLVKSDAGENPGVYAACYIKEGQQVLLKRFYDQQKEAQADPNLMPCTVYTVTDIHGSPAYFLTSEDQQYFAEYESACRHAEKDTGSSETLNSVQSICSYDVRQHQDDIYYCHWEGMLAVVVDGELFEKS